MALVRRSELKNLSQIELEKRLGELRKDLMKLQAQVASGTRPENPGKIRALKRGVARIITTMHSHQEVQLKA
ncbi:50S ribosomal protein L29 [Candidatus Woesearchaeota archaeon]|nr:50S ribosomal protein L29 [Candidatus Woesearchaeota archaeon]